MPSGINQDYDERLREALSASTEIKDSLQGLIQSGMMPSPSQRLMIDEVVHNITVINNLLQGLARLADEHGPAYPPAHPLPGGHDSQREAMDAFDDNEQEHRDDHDNDSDSEMY